MVEFKPQLAKGFQEALRWPLVRMSEVASLHYGRALTASSRTPGSVRVYGSNGQCGWHNIPLHAGPTVILGRKGQGPLGVEWCPWPFWVIDTAYYVTVDAQRIDLRYFYFLTKFIGLNHLKDGTSNPSLSRDVFGQQGIPLPPLPIQRRIAGILSAYDELIENSQRRIKILESMARGLYREWFVHFRFPGHESVPRVKSPLGEIPEGWEVKLVQHFGKVITGKTPSKANADFYGDDVPFVKTPDMHGNMFILGTSETLSAAGAESQANKMLPAGTICVSCIGTIGVVSITTEDCQTNQQINSVVMEKEVSREFLFLRLQDAKQTLENLGSNGATMCNVNKGKFEAMEIVSPSTELLVEYHRLARSMFDEILLLSRQIQNLRRTRDLLLPRLLSGQIDVEAIGS